MLDLIKKIDEAWKKEHRLYGIYPDKSLGYFNFRNNIILRYNRKADNYERKVNKDNSKMQQQAS